MKQFLLLSIVLGCAWLLGGCGGGGGGSGSPPPPAIHFSVTPAVGQAVPGIAFTVAVVALDTAGNTATTYAGSVRLSSSDAAASLPAPATLSQGSGTFTVTLNSAGNQSITAIDLASPSITGISSSINVVTVGPVSHFQVDVSPTVATSGTTVQVTVTALDASNYQVAAYAGSVKLTSSDSAAVIPAPAPLLHGQQVFSVTVATSGPQTITATDTVTPALTGQSQSIAVSGPATHLSVTGPATAFARAPLSITVTALDASNNTATSYNGSAHITSSDSQALLPAAAVALSGGGGAFNATLESIGTQTFTATDTVQASIAGTSQPIAVTAPPALAITSGLLPGGTVGSAYSPRRVRVCFRGRCRYIIVYNFPLLASGGVGNYTWGWAAAPGSSVPPGLSLAGNLISGTPPIGSVGTYNVVVTVTDGGSPSAQAHAAYAITIVNPPPPVIATLPGPQGATLNQPYSYQFQVTGGLAPVAVSESGSLPPGLGPLTTVGLLAGTPTSANLYPIVVHAIDAANQDTPQAFTIGVFQHGFAPTGGMQVMRNGHAATLLADGATVLVTGGQTGAGFVSELFNPASGSFAATASLQVGRVAHTATLLCDLTVQPCSNPKVLVAGGTATAGVVGSAELYDASIGTFTLTTHSMVTAREAHTATLLHSGKVLIAGGIGANAVSLATAELFDPANGTFTATTNNMSAARWSHTATLLADGRVLIAGGIDAASLHLSSAELYDPVAGTFSTITNAMTVTRAGHTATLLASGKVLIAGGIDSSGASLGTAELFDPAATPASFTATIGGLVTPRDGHRAARLPDGTVLLAGGYYQGQVLPHAEVFDPTSGMFAPTGGMQSARVADTLTALGSSGKVLVTGGFNGLTTLTAAELYQ